MARLVAAVAMATLMFAPGAAAKCCTQPDALCIVQLNFTRGPIQGNCDAQHIERDGCWRDNNNNNDLLGLAIASDRVCFGSNAECCKLSPLFIALMVGIGVLAIYICAVCCCIPGAYCNKNPRNDDNQLAGNPCCCGACKDWTCCLPNSSGEPSMEMLTY